MAKTIKVKDSFNKETEYKVVHEFPVGYVIWNIGRNNFPLKGYIPLALAGYKGSPYCIYPESKSALFVGNEKLARYLIGKAQHRTINQKKYNEIVKSFKE